jgi:hypothetical protein
MDNLLSSSFVALGILFAVWNALTFAQYIRYRQVASEAVLSWELPRPWSYNLCLGIGFFMLVLTLISALVLHRPVHVILAQGLMALFYTVLFPLSFRIRRGFYSSGIWMERRFVPYRRIRWLGWKKGPQIVLALRASGVFRGQRYSFLRVPGDYYGQARRILADSIDAYSLSLETSVLGLEEEAAPTQERV